ncbi:RNA polymerase sigma-70 factor, ECF subfamily [Mucilaginibacter pineti]|uniref:RNA polymerase sigma-70 factor, ECF subfamily n=1 Tax=Mucilaginibacter pineti TaxID=1391627 RepID=A0A1G7E5X9_9SPHI|nr:RNA polymerase sigma-70 factor [Mucilaginibacter pineti]SDE58765.1 RNA polymerase sigma-70 factor, ECF subfamily [Mucilaginibacter pineti]
MPATNYNDSDNGILQRIVAGDELAFQLLYQKNFDRVAKYTFKICKSEAVTEEIVQDVFLKLWLNRTAIGHVKNIEAYLFSIARNKTIDFLRRLALETNIIQTLSTQLTEVHNIVDEKLNADSLLLIVNEALRGLSVQKQQIFELSKIQGFSHDEISEKLQLSKSTVKNHLSETLKHLKKYIFNNPKKGILIVLYLFKAVL